MELTISEKLYNDLQKEIGLRKNGVLTFTLKVNRSKVADCVIYNFEVPKNGTTFKEIVDNAIVDIGFGNLTFVGVLTNGTINVQTLKITGQKRIKYDQQPQPNRL